MSLRKKLVLGFGITLALVLVVLAWAIANLVMLGSASDAILRENYKSIIAAEVMINAIERQDSASLLLALGYVDEGVAQFRENESEFLQSLARAADNITIAGESEIVSRIRARYRDYLLRFDELSALAAADSGLALAAEYHESMLPVFKEIRAACEDLRNLNQSTMFAASSRATSVAERATWSTLVVGLAATFLGLSFSFFMAAQITRPLRQLLAATRRVAEGDYSAQVLLDSNDELGRLAGGFNDMAGQLEAYNNLNVEQALAQKRLTETVLESIDDGILVVDRELRLMNINRAAATLLGAREAAVPGRHISEFINEDRVLDLITYAVDVSAAPVTDRDEPVLCVTGEFGTRYLSYTVSPILMDTPPQDGGHSTVRGAVLLLRDVTRVRELDRLKSEFVMTASHELRTPLTGLEMSVELLRDKITSRLSDKERELLDAAHEDVLRLKSLVSDLLDLSRIEGGRITLDFSSVDLRSVVDGIVGIFRDQFAAKGASLVTELRPELPEVRADASKIAWVLSNLVSNALRYVDEGGHVWIDADKVGRMLSISVRDDGAGIPYEYQSRVFDKFVQVAGDPSPGKTGLGLTICREIVHAHGGSIWLDSHPGEGSTFTFTLPIADDKERREP